MKVVYVLVIFIAIFISVNAQEKISSEEKAARKEWIEKHKILPPNATQQDIEKFYKSLPKSTADSLTFFELQIDNKKPNVKIVGPNNERGIPIPPDPGKEKIIPIPVYQQNDEQIKEIR